MRVLVVFDHPRRNSFTGAVLDAYCEGLAVAGHATEIADLRAERFDPRMPEIDEPDWFNDDQAFSAEVLAEQERLSRNDAVAFVFPVWWWGLPATTKGWVERVWNDGFAFGNRKLPHRRARLLGVAASTKAHYDRDGYEAAMRVQLVTGIMRYCGIEDARLDLLYDSLGEPPARTALLAQARELGRSF